jgi:hypothetical protein
MGWNWLTPAIAIYGGALSTWVGIQQWKKERPQIRVAAFIGIALSPTTRVVKEQQVVVKMTNSGRRNVTLKGVFIHRGKDVHLFTQHKSLPKTLEPTQEIAEIYGTNLLAAETTRLGAYDTEGREWTVPRKQLASLKKKAAAIV